MGDHDDDVRVLLPDHPPEGGRRLPGRALRADVGPRGAEAVDVVGVDVVVPAALRLGHAQPDAGVVV